jgi:hypothetical protein
MLYLLGVLLTEIKVLGISLRSPLLLFVQFVFSHFIYFVVLFTLLYAYVLLDSEFQLNKSNAVILFVVTLGALFLSRVDATFDPVKLGRMLIFVYIGLSILSIMQLLGLGGSVTSLFIVTEVVDARATGLSGEPSFFAWMATYFILIGYALNLRIASILFFVLIVVFTESVSLLAAPIIYMYAFIIVRILKRRFKNSMFIHLIIMIFIPIVLERVLHLFFGISLGDLSLEYLSSWREISIFSSIYSSELIGSFSRGSDWGESILQGQFYILKDGDVMAWINTPWNLLSMWLIEFGVIFSLVFIYTMCKNQKNIHKIYTTNRTYTAHLSLYFIGLFLAPKWAVFFFLMPILQIRNRGVE